MQQKPMQVLQYATMPRHGRGRVGLAALVVTVLLAAGGRVPFRRALSHFNTALAVKACLRWQPRAKAVAEDPRHNFDIVGVDLGDADDAFLARYPAWKAVCDATMPHPLSRGAPVFIHGLRAPSGTRRLVVVEHRFMREFSVVVIDPGSFIRAPKVVSDKPARVTKRLEAMLSIYLSVPDSKLWIGNIDPVDPGQFKIPFSYRGSTGEIVGRIGDDDEIDLDIPDVDGLLSRLNPACRSDLIEYYNRSLEYYNRTPQR
jgi:hypothetical protein